jgi:hypothetical protein
MYIKNKMETNPSIEPDPALAIAVAQPTYQRQMELCIPKVSVNISQKTIFQVFCKLKIGYIVKIIENQLKNDPSYKRIIIRIHWDNTQPLAKEIQEHLKNPTEHMNIVYDMPWYWQIFANHLQHHPASSKPKPLSQQSVPSILVT